MAISRIRGEQIKQEVLKNQHISADAAIAESKLDIAWNDRYRDAMISRKLVDFVQVSNTNVGGKSSINLVAASVFTGTETTTDSNPLSAEGVIVSGAKNVAVIRDVATGEPILDKNGKEIVGKVELTAGVPTLSLFESNGVTPFVAPAGLFIDWQYAERFNLNSVSEMFAANEKFVNGSSDVTSHLNISQLAQDLYGAAFSLDRDGSPNLPKSIVQQLSEEVAARIAADKATRDDLASTFAGKGASLIGVQDAAGNFVEASVEGVLSEIDARLKGLAGGGSTTQDEVTAARTSAATGSHATLDERLEAGEVKFAADLATEAARAIAAENAMGIRVADLESKVQEDVSDAIDAEKAERVAAEDELDARADLLESEVHTARGTTASLDARLDRALNEDGTLKVGIEIHRHFKAYFQSIGGEQIINLSNFNIAGLPDYQVGDQSLDVFVNGILQNEGLHYVEVFGGKAINFDVAADGTTLFAGDIVTIKYQVNMPE